VHGEATVGQLTDRLERARADPARSLLGSVQRAAGRRGTARYYNVLRSQGRELSSDDACST